VNGIYERHQATFIFKKELNNEYYSVVEVNVHLLPGLPVSDFACRAYGQTMPDSCETDNKIMTSFTRQILL
jgi:hypothetical protein